MAPPVVGKRYTVYSAREGDFVGRCVAAKGDHWEFKLESLLEGRQRNWGIGDVVEVRDADVDWVDEIPLDAQG